MSEWRASPSLEVTWGTGTRDTGIGARGHGDTGTRGHGDTGHGDTGTRGHGDTGTRGHGDTATRGTGTGKGEHMGNSGRGEAGAAPALAGVLADAGHAGAAGGCAERAPGLGVSGRLDHGRTRAGGYGGTEADAGRVARGGPCAAAGDVPGAAGGGHGADAGRSAAVGPRPRAGGGSAGREHGRGAGDPLCAAGRRQAAPVYGADARGGAREPGCGVARAGGVSGSDPPAVDRGHVRFRRAAHRGGPAGDRPAGRLREADAGDAEGRQRRAGDQGGRSG